MAITVENIFDASAEREGLYIKSLRRVVYVSGIDSANPVGYIAQVATAEAVPRQPIVVGGSLLVYKREAITISDQPNGKATVEIFYERPAWQVVADESGQPAVTGGTSIQQVTTERDSQGEPILLSYTYPDDDPDFPGETKTQGATIQPLEPRSTLTIPVVEETNQPGALSRDWVGYVNSDEWNGAGPRMWMCISAPFTPVDLSSNPHKWLLMYSFERAQITHDPEATFIDPRTGRPPADLVEDVGYKRIPYNPSRSFGAKFPP
jgi:hypothetical protein